MRRITFRSNQTSAAGPIDSPDQNFAEKLLWPVVLLAALSSLYFFLFGIL